jgi:TRAP-type C4-dicarboxylate transport system substrate-binding protein
MSSADDIKGMKMRAWNLPLSKWVERMGGVPYSIPFAELYTSLAAGVVEANAMAPVTVLEKKLNEVAGYFNMWPSGTVVFATFVNLEKFNALPVNIQNILMEEANKAEKENWKLQAVATAPAIEKMKELGMEIVQPSEDELAKAAAVDKAIYNEWFEEAPADVKDLAKRVLTELGK